MDANDLNLLKVPLVKKTEPVSIPLIKRTQSESKAFIEGVKAGIAIRNDGGADTAKAALEIMMSMHKELFGEEIG